MARPDGAKKPKTLEPQQPKPSTQAGGGLAKGASAAPKVRTTQVGKAKVVPGPKVATNAAPASTNLTLEQYLAGLRQHESGGRYDAKNSTSSASGAYQYLNSTWNNYKGYARAMDAPPEVQDERARMDAQALLKKYGGDWEKVAAAHFRGAGWVDANPDKSKWMGAQAPGVNPTTGAFVRSVLSKAGIATPGVAGGVGRGASAGAGGTTPGGGSAGALGPDGKVDPQQAIASYGYIAELANTVPDIKRVLTDAIKRGLTPELFQAEIRKTAWWRKTTESQRAADVLKATNPAEFNRKLQEIADAIVIQSRNIGVPQDNAKIKALAEKALRLGWSQQEINRYVAADIKVKATGNTGATAVTVDSLKQQAKDFLVPISDATLQQWTTQILKGDVPAEAFQSYLKEQAKSQWPSLANALDAGVSVSQYVNPYRELAAQTLEMNPDDIDFMQPKWGKALFQIGKDGQRTAMSLADWGQYLRKQPEYGRTRAANAQAAAFTSSLLETFGKV